jgi:uncharacterized RDD family membrane protein YckC
MEFEPDKVKCSGCGELNYPGDRNCWACGQGLRPPTREKPGGRPLSLHTASGTSSASVQYADFGSRVSAFLYDRGTIWVLYFGWVITLCIIFYFALPATRDTDAAQIVLFALALGGLLVFEWIYFAWMECSEAQGALGKQRYGLVVTDLRGRRISFWRASVRSIARIPAAVPLVGIIWSIPMFLTPRKQALHDLIAGTVVLRR